MLARPFRSHLQHICCRMTATDSHSEFKLTSPPDDGITAVKFCPGSSQFLLASSWDTTVRLYDVTTNVLRIKYPHAGAVLDCCFYDPVHSYSGGLDNTLKMFDFNVNSGEPQRR